MYRRNFLASIGTLPLLFSQANADAQAFESLIEEARANPELIEQSWAFRDPTVSRGIPKGRSSQRKLSRRAIDLIVAFEVSSRDAYERKYRKAIWPRGQSGVTIGIGYDLKFSNKNFVDRDWHMLPQNMRNELYSVTGLGGQEARRALKMVPSVDISWKDAESQFMAFIQYPAGQTEGAFPNCDTLPDDCFGALVSLVYNRGPDASNTSRRKEMYEIKQLMNAQNLEAIPNRIRAMKRIWAGDKDAVGLLRRRDAEAALFELGLA